MLNAVHVYLELIISVQQYGHKTLYLWIRLTK